MTDKERKSCINTINTLRRLALNIHGVIDVVDNENCERVIAMLENDGWIPVTERLPEELEPVIITFKNHNPESYYADIKDKPLTATGLYFYGKWYWWSTLCTDMLAEYGHNYSDIINDDIEITAWMPLPKPYEGSEKSD